MSQRGSILAFRPRYRDGLLRKSFHFRELRFVPVSFAILRLLSRDELPGLFGQVGRQGDAACEHERALTLHEESLSHYERMGDKAGVALALVNLGEVTRKRGEKERAAVLYEEALALQRELGNERGATRALARLTTIR